MSSRTAVSCLLIVCLTQLVAVAQPPPYCKLGPDPGPCKAAIPSYFYNANSATCEPFTYGGCQGNQNRFQTQQECRRTCSTAADNARCLLPQDPGPCRARFTKFYYSRTTQTCKRFIYGGCRGNDNRFDTLQACQNRCLATYLAKICNLPAAPGRCLAYFEKFFFNVTSGACEKFIYGGCDGNTNNFDNEAECQQKCILS